MGQNFSWYANLIKPSWAPPSWLFGPVWLVLYSIIAVSFVFVFYKAITKQIQFIVVLPFVLNLIFNFAFSPIQFELRNNQLASVDIVLVLVTLIWAFISIWPYSKIVVFANIPYFLWVSFATMLQFTITFLNR